MTGRLLAIAVAGLVLAGAASASSAGHVPRFVGCSPPSVVRPHRILVACGDGGYYLAQLTWSEWTPIGATAAGVAHINDCTPNCAAGHFHTYSGIQVSLDRPVSCANHRRLFTRILWKFTAAKPSFMKKRVARERAPFGGNPVCPIG